MFVTPVAVGWVDVEKKPGQMLNQPGQTPVNRVKNGECFVASCLVELRFQCDLLFGEE